MEDEVVDAGVGVVDVLACVVGDALGLEQLAAGVVDGYHLVDDAHRAAVLVDEGLFGNTLATVVVGRERRVGLVRLLAVGGFSISLMHLYGAVPCWVGKEACDVSEVHDGEMCLSLTFAYASASTYNLLELGHGVDALVEDDEFHHLAVNARREQFAGCSDDGIF